MTAPERARAWLSQKPLVLDTETTGIGPRDEVVQVAVVDTDGEALLYTLVRPTRAIPLDAMRIHGISDGDVMDAPTGADVCRSLPSLLSGRLLCTYNADFDTRLLAQTARAWRVGLPSYRAECVMKLYAEHAGQWDAARRNYRWHSLEAAVRRCRLGEFQGHDALADARMTLKLLEHIAATA